MGNVGKRRCGQAQLPVVRCSKCRGAPLCASAYRLIGALPTCTCSVDKVNIKGYFAWTMFDNFEWLMAYEER